MELVLRATAPEDLPAVLALEGNPDVARWVTRWSEARHRDAISDPDQAHLTYTRRGLFAGFLLLAGLSAEDRSVELRRIALRDRGAGLGATAMRLALEHAFQACGAHRVWLDLLPDNARALRLYERSGFGAEGLLPGAHLLPDGSSADLRVMSILREQWADGRSRGAGGSEPRA